MKEAKTLQQYDYYGRGSKWRGRLVLGGLLALAAVGCGIRFKSEIAPQDRAWFIGLFFVIFVAVLLFSRVTCRKADSEVRLEVSEREVVIGAGEGRTVIQWWGFSQCLESPNLFVLVNRTKTILFAVPKRVFPDEAAQDWFRSQANQTKGVAAMMLSEALVPGRFVTANGIALTLRLKFRDYLNRNLTSWRMKGIFLGMLAIMTVVNFVSTPPADSVNSPSKTFLIMVPILLGIMVVGMVFVSFFSWVVERKHLVAQEIVLNDAGIDFVARDSSGRLPWTTYKYYQENRWSFFVWQPQGSVCLMLPKRNFTSPSELAQFRALLEKKLKRSRWFYL